MGDSFWQEAKYRGMGKTKEVVREEEWGQVVVMDTAAQIGPEETGQVVVMGSQRRCPRLAAHRIDGPLPVLVTACTN